MHLPNGAQIFVEATRSPTAVAVTSISNAVKPVFTATGSTLAIGDLVIVATSTWAGIENKVLRVTAVTGATSFTCEGVDTTDVNKFPVGATAQVFKILTWMEIPCVQEVGKDGGEQQYYTYQCLADEKEQQTKTFKSAINMTYSFAHDFQSPIYPILRKADESGAVTAMRMYIPKAKEMRLWSGEISFDDIPTTEVNTMETVSISVAMRGAISFVTPTTP